MMKGLQKKWTAFIVMITLMIAAVPVSRVTAAGGAWIRIGDGSYMLDGTDITVQILGDTIHVSGNGALPDYDERTLSQRPWHKAACKNLLIDNTITSIGTYAFASLTELKKITLNSTTFIADKTSFAGIAYAPVFHILGYTEAVTYIGTIPYTSLDSIKAFAQKNSHDASFLLDHSYMVPLFQNSTNPTISNVYCAYDANKPWEDVVANHNGNQQTEFCRLLSASSGGCLELSAQKLYADKSVYEAFASVIGDNIFAYTFSMTMQRNGRTSVTQTLEPMYYQLTLPDELTGAGRIFQILSIGQGSIEILDDLDTSDKTVTFMTKIPQAVFAVVYQ